jgi:carbon storage regulator
MLVLARKLGDKIRICDDIVITVVEIKRNVIRLGIEAPKDLRISREDYGHEKSGDDRRS